MQFLNCKTIADLRSFTRAWGPLYLDQTRGKEDIRFGKAVRRLDECEAHRRWLRAVKRMIDACRGIEDERNSLIEFLAAEVDMERTSNTYKPGKVPIFHDLLRLQYHFEGDAVTWATSSDADSVKKVLAYSVETYVRAPLGSLAVETTRKGFVVKPSFLLSSLWEALTWMLWFDEWNRWPPVACRECHKVFRPLTAHKKKYCTHECAHRATNREWRRKDLRQRKKILKAKANGGTYGTRKTR